MRKRQRKRTLTDRQTERGAAMDSLTVYTPGQIQQAQDFNPGLFAQFVQWIDRSE